MRYYHCSSNLTKRVYVLQKESSFQILVHYLTTNRKKETTKPLTKKKSISLLHWSDNGSSGEEFCKEPYPEKHKKRIKSVVRSFGFKTQKKGSCDFNFQHADGKSSARHLNNIQGTKGNSKVEVQKVKGKLIAHNFLSESTGTRCMAGNSSAVVPKKIVEDGICQPVESVFLVSQQRDIQEAPGELINNDLSRDNSKKAPCAVHSPFQIMPNSSDRNQYNCIAGEFPNWEKKSLCKEDLDQPGESSRPMADLFDFNKSPGEFVNNDLFRDNLGKASLANHSPHQEMPKLSVRNQYNCIAGEFPIWEKKSLCNEDLDQHGESSRPMADLFDFNEAPGELINNDLFRDKLEKASLASHSPLQKMPNLSDRNQYNCIAGKFPNWGKKNLFKEGLGQPGESSRLMADLFDFNEAPVELSNNDLLKDNSEKALLANHSPLLMMPNLSAGNQYNCIAGEFPNLEKKIFVSRALASMVNQVAQWLICLISMQHWVSWLTMTF